MASYDANGNVNSRNGQSITWYSYNLPLRINYGGRYARFWYGADRQRYKQEHDVYPGSYASTRQTLYVKGLYEIADTVLSSGDSEETIFRHYIIAGGQRVASHIRYRYAYLGGRDEVQWTTFATSDHLGSVDSHYYQDQYYTATTPDARYSNDAYGKRRDHDWNGSPASTDLEVAWFDFSNRGFTDHEHLDGVDGLIHMNGRVYDPVIGRFMSADPFVQAPYFSQSLNRYSYTFNNPLSFIDPSGFQGNRTIPLDFNIGTVGKCPAS